MHHGTAGRTGEAAVEVHGNEGSGARAQGVPRDNQAPALAVQLALHERRHVVPRLRRRALPGRPGGMAYADWVISCTFHAVPGSATWHDNSFRVWLAQAIRPIQQTDVNPEAFSRLQRWNTHIVPGQWPWSSKAGIVDCGKEAALSLPVSDRSLGLTLTRPAPLPACWSRCSPRSAAPARCGWPPDPDQAQVVFMAATITLSKVHHHPRGVKISNDYMPT